MQEKSLTIRERDWKLSRSWNRNNRAGIRKESKGGRRLVGEKKKEEEQKLLLAFVAGLIRTGVLHILIIAWLIVAPCPPPLIFNGSLNRHRPSLIPTFFFIFARKRSAREPRPFVKIS